MARKRKLRWMIFPSYLAITLISLIAVGGSAALVLRDLYLDQTASDLLIRARLVEEIVKEKLTPDRAAELQRLCLELGKSISTRITVILPSGTVIADSDEDPARMENHADRPEIIAALAQGSGQHVRHSHTLNRDMMYVAVAVKENGGVVGVVRASEPVATLSQALRRNYRKIALAGLIVALLASGASWLVAGRLGRVLALMREGARRFSEGDLGFRLRPPDSEEFGALAETMNRMAEELEERIQTVTGQRNELAAVLAGMVEAVVVVDVEEKLVRINQAGGKLFGTSPEAVQGRRVEEVLRNAALLQFISRTLASDPPIEGELTLFQEGEERSLQVHGNIVRDRQGRKTHALLVLNDVTRLKKLERVRRDFVANVSHELKTPLTSIKAAVETLKAGVASHEAGQFVDIILRHADRLNAIIDDLLALSRIEQGEERDEIELAPGRVREVLAAAVAALERAAHEKNIRLELEGDGELTALINPELLEQAVSNLLDNAVKYSGEGTTVRVRAEREGGHVVISVADQGPGIPAEHLERIFERFYRVDKARSRKLGGTGLGLSIARHIAAAHGGEIRVASEVGQGSVFKIFLPGLK